MGQVASPIDVSVAYKHGQRRLGAAGRTSLIGDGLFDRVRVASLALLGGMTAVGLAIVALAFNQSWPLVPGSAIPALPPKHQVVGSAVVVARPALPSTQVGTGRIAPLRRSQARPQRVSAVPSGGAGPGAEGPVATVVSRLTPATPLQGAQQDQSSSQRHGPAVQHHDAETPTTVAVAPPTTESAPPSTPSPAPEAAPPASVPPVAATVEPPEEETESNLPPWSNGNGHGYGREDGWHGHESADDDSQGDGWGDEDWRDRGWGDDDD